MEARAGAVTEDHAAVQEATGDQETPGPNAMKAPPEVSTANVYCRSLS